MKVIPVKDSPRGRRTNMRRLVILLLKGYKKIISPYLPSQCLYEPTCSVYAQDAVREHGVFKGIRMTFNRLGRCNPAFEGGYDPVPTTGSLDTESEAGAGHEA
ncbi:MAG: membrane protein insertion efficiency factor YidD [Chloroflexi bacterium]|nr:membrane protein insertion efficiency factor YidD [Chloroflexota bacterium]MBT4073891.1 membrane protein insertion efficiency factor YidD [Chloroflexota bacterium]MBT4514509.1 membrane protein insertion efficiency factor YidD [Chloroflexota bacterium]MBT5318379.1 membrane protein insertion efficiency factor YidD [Chloroflexota bacterium]MBT6683168.1 membrane protein insertion efficiency factor YidD [Chloroflexota bacterium]